MLVKFSKTCEATISHSHFSSLVALTGQKSHDQGLISEGITNFCCFTPTLTILCAKSVNAGEHP